MDRHSGLATFAALRGQVKLTASLENDGYRTLHWSVMHHFQTAAGLNVSIGDAPLAAFPNFERGFVPADGYQWGPPPSQLDRGFVSLDAITGRTINLHRVTSELSALEGWVGVAARPTQLHRELRAWLTSAAKRYSKERFEGPILREKGWWTTASTSLARARRHLEIWCSGSDAWCKTVMRSLTALRERCSEPYPWACEPPSRLTR
eukprot:3401098-Rhodomonas_salina.2